MFTRWTDFIDYLEDRHERVYNIYYNTRFFDWSLLKEASYEVISGRFMIWDVCVWEYLLADHPSFSTLLCRVAGHPYSTYHQGYDPPDETPYCINCGDESWGQNRGSPWWQKESLTPHG